MKRRRFDSTRNAVLSGVTVAVILGSALLTAPVAATASPAASSTFHVNCSEAEDGDGSVRAPWNSLDHVNRKTGFSAGDRILFKRGMTCKGRVRPVGNGSPGSPIVLGAYGTGRKPTIAGGGTPDSTGTVHLINQSYWTVQDLHVTNAGKSKETTAYRSGVLLQGNDGRLKGLVVRRLDVNDVVSNLTPDSNEPRDFGGIAALTLADGTRNAGFDDLTILDNRVSRVGRTGIVVNSRSFPRSRDTGLRIGRNTVTRARGDSIFTRGQLDARIIRNTVADGADFWPCKQCGAISPATANAGIWPAHSLNTVIERNEVYGTRQLGGDGVGIDADVSAINTTIQYNYVHDNEGGGILFCGSKNTTARFNILENNARGAFVFIGDIAAYRSKIYNNTVYTKRGTDARVVHLQGGKKGGKGVTFFNNLIYNLDDSGYYMWPTTPKTRSNTYIGVHGIGEPSEVGKQYDDPGLRNPGSGGKGFTTLTGYRPSSPKGDPVGSPVPKSVKVDFFGKKIDPRKPPRGAAG